MERVVTFLWLKSNSLKVREKRKRVLVVLFVETPRKKTRWVGTVLEGLGGINNVNLKRHIRISPIALHT